ncbi:unnamed protein product [Sphagnum tenellum]
MVSAAVGAVSAAVTGGVLAAAGATAGYVAVGAATVGTIHTALAAVCCCVWPNRMDHPWSRRRGRRGNVRLLEGGGSRPVARALQRKTTEGDHPGSARQDRYHQGRVCSSGDHPR